MENFCLKFDERSILNKINFKINDKGLLIVTGSACSGKSALLKAILGEFGLNLKGIIVKGSVSYASQEPWIFPGSIRQNILFGQEFNEKRYQDVIARCALEYDFQQFENGDETFVVDNGNNLSKGQKIRINLARAIYRERQIYLLDSVLTSLDVNTSQHIFNRVMKDFMKDKICILISDNSNYFNDANQILELSKSSAKLIKNENSVVDIIQREYTVANQKFSNKALESGNIDINDESTRLLENACNPKKKTYNYQEYNIDGNIKLETFKMYAKLCSGYWVVAGVLILFILSELFSVINNRFLSNWITNEEKYISFLSTNQSKEKNESFASLITERRQSFQIFIGSFILHFILFSSAAVGCFVITLQASRILHNKMLISVINAKMDFFCSTLIGTLLNRFSIDVSNVDEKLPFYVFSSIVIIFDSIGLFVIVALLKSIFIAPTLIIVIFGIVVMKLFLLPATTKAKRLESALHSPMEGYLNNTLNGLSTIRVLGPGQEKLIEEFGQYQDKFATASFILICSARTLKIFLQIISIGLLIFILCYFFLTEGNTPGDVGLGIVKALVIITTINYTFTDYMQAESIMSSLERISHYLKIDQESRTGLDLTNDWPQEGSLNFKHVNLYYKSMNECALHDINLDIKSQEKVALIGRTGSGKTSLISCLFRLYNFSGRILLDNIDIQHLGLGYLRSRFGIVSQDALILSGTLRENIDPFNEFSDNDILKVASSIIKDFKLFGLGKNKNPDIQSFDLNIVVNENNLTPSEKQIISLLRVLLSKKSIIILDEVTGNLDENISDNIEKLIKEQCRNKTIITIVHKLKNIQHMDKICVLEDGQIKEFDTPSNLLNNPNSYFRGIISNINKKEI